jgi:pimeloyl-ACP methyl ester carboxylesterase
MTRSILALGILVPSLILPRVATIAERTSLQPQSPSDPLRALRAHSGGYLRPPTHRRVIIFINGIFGDAVSTWQSGNGSYWPSLLIADTDFAEADIYVHSFDSPKIATAQNIDELAGRMNDVLLVDKVLKDHDEAVFICHSMGGLITRAFLLKYRPDPKQVPMIYFFSTPTTGANITEIAKHLSNNPQLQYMLPLKEEGYVGDLQNQWLATSDDPKLSYPLRIASYCAYEKLDTFGVRIVERQSATNLCNRETRGIVANHMDMVKPRDTASDPYVFFKAAYDRTFGPAAGAISSTVQQQIGKPIDERQSLPIFSTKTEKLSLRRVNASRTYIDVDCEQTKTGEIVAQVDLDPSETIVEVNSTVENADNVSKSSTVVIRHDERSAVIRYSLRGLDKNMLGLNCPGGGHATIVASFVISRKISPPTMP